MAQLPSVLNRFHLYREGARGVLGIVDVELPTIENMTETLSGGGFGGEADIAVLGAYTAMSATINARTPNIDLAALMDNTRAHNLTLRAVIQKEDGAQGLVVTEPWIVTMRVKGKSLELGKAETGTTTDSSIEVSVYAIKAELNGRTIVEIDQFNDVAIINGVNQLAAIKKIL